MGKLTKMQPRAEWWAKQICAELSKTAASIIEAGRLLLKAKGDLAHGEWGRMFKDRDGLIPLTQNTANRYMAIATNPVLSNSAHVQNLPPSWGTLYELTKLPEPTLKHALKDGLITPDMERKQVKALAPSSSGPKARRKKGDVEVLPPESGPTALHRTRYSALYSRVVLAISDEFYSFTSDEQREFLSLLGQHVVNLRAEIDQS